MKLRDRLFGVRVTPVREHMDPTFGSMTWSADDDAWCFVHDGRRIFIGFDRASEAPRPELLDYARSILSDSKWIEEALASAKRDHLARHPSQASELSMLQIQEIAFNHHEKGAWMLWNLGEPVPDHFWFVEFRGRRCMGMGFDT